MSLLAQHLVRVQTRALQDALSEASATYWERRAAAFAAVGTETCDEVAQSCRNQAQFLRDYGLDAEARALAVELLNHGAFE